MSDEIIKTLLEKASNYDFLNHIIPGSIFCCVFEKMSGHVIFGESFVTSLVLVYFAGILISRVGSLLVEPFCTFNFWKIGSIVKYAPYKDYIKAEKVDKKISLLVARNNMYRTFVAMSGMLLSYRLVARVSNIPCFAWTHHYKFELIILSVFALFVVSFQKQTSYVRKRVEKVLEANADSSKS